VDSFRIEIDGKTMVEKATGNEVNIPLVGLSKGVHNLTVIAEGGRTRFPISWTEMDTPLETPVPVKVEVPFTVL
jgi:hypothetical protein